MLTERCFITGFLKHTAICLNTCRVLSTAPGPEYRFVFQLPSSSPLSIEKVAKFHSSLTPHPLPGVGISLEGCKNQVR